MVENKGVIPAKTLSAHVGADGVFCVFIDQQNCIIDNRVIDFDKYLSLDKESIKVLTYTSTNKYLFSQNFEIQNGEDFTSGLNKLTGQQVYVKYINSHIDISAAKHLVTLLDDFYFLSKKNVVHLHFEKNRLHIYIRQNGLFIFYNNFEVENEQDVLYFTTLALDNINDPIPQDTIWSLSGWIDDNSTIHQKVKSHFPDFEFAITPLTFAPQMKDQKSHYYFIHYLNLQCAS
jgi:hypothetical protein